MKIKGSISIGYSGASRKFDYSLGSLGLTQEEWDGFSEKERDAFLQEVLDTEIGNVLDAAIWVEE